MSLSKLFAEHGVHGLTPELRAQMRQEQQCSIRFAKLPIVKRVFA